jgi:hypothetical protein
MRVLARLLCLAVALPCSSCDKAGSDEELTAPSSSTGDTTDTGATTFDSDATCIDREQGRAPGARYFECLYSCRILTPDDVTGDAMAKDRETYEQQSQDPNNECFQIRFAFEECIRDYTCADLEAFRDDLDNSNCAEEWMAFTGPGLDDCFL